MLSRKNNFNLLFILISQFIFSQTQIDKINIDSKDIQVTNLSGKLNDSISFHLIINKFKHSTMHKSILYLYSKTKKVKTFPELITSEKPNFLSYHINQNTLTLIRNEHSKIEVIDYNYFKKGYIKSSFPFKVKTIASHNNQTILLGEYKKNKSKIAFIKSSEDIKRLDVKPNTKSEKVFLKNLMSNKHSEFINTGIYLKKGSIKAYKGFLNNQKLVYVHDNKKKSIVTLFTINNNGEIKSKWYNVSNGEKSKKIRSFLLNEFLFVFTMKVNISVLKIYSIKTDKLIKSFEYNDINFGPNNKVIIKGEDVTGDFSPKKFLNSFSSTVFGSEYLAELYIGVNKSVNNNYIIQIGHVDKNNFNNNTSYNNWWYKPAFHLNFSSNGEIQGSFNTQNIVSYIISYLANEKRKGYYFELNLNQDLTINEKLLSHKYPFFNTDYYIKDVEDKLKLKNHFFLEMNNFVRLINYDKKNNSYNIYNLKKY